MLHRWAWLCVGVAALVAGMAVADPPSADDVLDRLLPASGVSDKPAATTEPTGLLSPATKPAATTRPAAMLREGTYLVDRVARIVPSADRREWVIHLEADGRGLKDPPQVALPSRKLQDAEGVVGDSGEKKVRVSGTVTEYRGRNYLLLEKVTPVPPPGKF